jgi:hypothetical protein
MDFETRLLLAFADRHLTVDRGEQQADLIFSSGETTVYLELKHYLRSRSRQGTCFDMLREPSGFWDLTQLQLAQAKNDARTRVAKAVERLRAASAADERRAAAREFLAALAELVAVLLHFLVRVLLLLLSRLLGESAAMNAPAWKPVPIETTPQVAPRGPNSAFPVNTYRGGHDCSTLGSVELAA